MLLDKDGMTAAWPEPAGMPWIVEHLKPREFDDLVQEFWFVSTYVAKHLWRNEPLAAKVICDHELKYFLKYFVVRRMLDWRVGLANDWSTGSGFFERGLQRRLDAATWDAFMATYVGIERNAHRAALFTTIELFRTIAIELAEQLGFAYPHATDERISGYLRAIRNIGPRPTW